jgi:hypothetical protein
MNTEAMIENIEQKVEENPELFKAMALAEDEED